MLTVMKCSSTDPDLCCVSVTAPSSPSKKLWSSHSVHVADLVDLHSLVAEHGDVIHWWRTSLEVEGDASRRARERRWMQSEQVATTVGSTAGTGNVSSTVRCWHECKSLMKTSTSCLRRKSRILNQTLMSVITSSRIVFQSHDKYCDECHDKNRFGCAIEFKCVFDSRFEGCFEYGFDCVYTQSESSVSWGTKIRLRPSTSGA